jgi:hypothetical protein
VCCGWIVQLASVKKDLEKKFNSLDKRIENHFKSLKENLNKDDHASILLASSAAQ